MHGRPRPAPWPAGLLAAAAVVWAATAGAPARRAPCAECVLARYWTVPADQWRDASRPVSFPEWEDGRLERLRPHDFGIAFSGGGTRSAAAVIGQLRGLARNGWLDRARYVTAVSGGSWAAVPWIYHRGDFEALVGAWRDPAGIDPAALAATPDGRLAEAVAASGLAQIGMAEVPSFLAGSDRTIDTRFGAVQVDTIARALGLARTALRKVRGRDLPEPDRENKTFAHMLGRTFVAPLVPGGNQRPYAWDREMAVEIARAAGRPSAEFTLVPADRPFLIAGGTLVWEHGALKYPRLIPVEYTPLYTGVRQRFGRIGGVYVWPWAYDRLEAAPAPDAAGFIRVGPGPSERPFTLADVVASSGAAPQLMLMLGDRFPARLRAPLRRAAGAFPAYTTLAIGDQARPDLGDELAHGDGGFTDNLGVMPLLARQVRNILVFVNSSVHYDRNDQLQSFFMPLAVRTGSGDKSLNAVFAHQRYLELLDGFDRAVAAGGPAVACGRGWEVERNEVYNIRGYQGLNICWVHTSPVANWRRDLPAVVRSWLDGYGGRDRGGALAHFPYYATFFERKPYVIKLTPLQVNLLAHLTAWTVTSDAVIDAAVGTFGERIAPRPARRD